MATYRYKVVETSRPTDRPSYHAYRQPIEWSHDEDHWSAMEHSEYSLKKVIKFIEADKKREDYTRKVVYCDP